MRNPSICPYNPAHPSQIGYNDPTPAAPVGGNPGTTIGEQRLNAVRHAASIWAQSLASPVEITVLSIFTTRACTPTAAVLASAGATQIFANFDSVGLSPGPEFQDTWYHVALANKRAGVDLVPADVKDPVNNPPDDLRVFFNINLGQPNCLAGSPFYYGFDTPGPSSTVNLVATALHEMGHGLGFSQFASVTDGTQISDLTDVYARNLLDVTTGKSWSQMTNAERAASAISGRKVVWTGPNVTAAVPDVLVPGFPLLNIGAPAAIAGNYAIGTAAFGPPVSSPGVTGQVVLALDASDAAGPSETDGCSPITNTAELAGQIALLDRGTCGFVVKVKNAQNAGAIAVLVADNVAGFPPAGLGGADPTITIPSVRIALSDGTAIKAQLAGGVTATLGVDLSLRAGADEQGRVMMNAPSPVQLGSSISHWDPVASRNLLMEPAINTDLTHSVKPPEDLTLPQMRDIGWFADADVDGLTDALDACPQSLRPATVTFGTLSTGVPNRVFSDGCTTQDRVAACLAESPASDGALMACVAPYRNALPPGTQD